MCPGLGVGIVPAKNTERTHVYHISHLPFLPDLETPELTAGEGGRKRANEDCGGKSCLVCLSKTNLMYRMSLTFWQKFTLSILRQGENGGKALGVPSAVPHLLSCKKDNIVPAPLEWVESRELRQRWSLPTRIGGKGRLGI